MKRRFVLIVEYMPYVLLLLLQLLIAIAQTVLVGV